MQDKDKGVYSPPSEDYERFDVADDEDSRRGPMLLVVAVAVLFAFAAVIYTAYHQGIRSGGREEAPLIAAQKEPVKTRPKDQAPEQKRPANSAYERLDNPGGKEDVKTAPPPEQPIKQTQTAMPKPAPKPVASPSPKRTPISAPKPAAQNGLNANGKYLVQLGAFRQESQAKDFWGRLSGRLPVVMDGAQMNVQRADLGAKGIYYRLRAAAFIDRPAAMKFCNQLKANGQDCIVVAK